MERLMAKKREALERMSKSIMMANLKNSHVEVEKLPHREEGKTRDIIGKELGVSGRQVDKKIMRKVDKESRWRSAKEGGSKTEPKIK